MRMSWLAVHDPVHDFRRLGADLHVEPPTKKMGSASVVTVAGSV